MHFEEEIPKLEQVGIPKDLAPICFGIAIGLMSAGSFLIMIQQFEIVGYICLIGFLVPVTYFMHIVPVLTASFNISSKEDSSQVIQLHIIQTLKNISLIGACLKFIINEAEKASDYVDNKRKKEALKNNKKQSKKRR